MKFTRPATAGVDIVGRLVREIKIRLNNRSTNRQWTNTLKAVLQEIAKSIDEDYVVWHSQSQGEFMLDLVWRRSKSCPDLLLAMESEWGNEDEVLTDFEKLMQIKASLKLMIFTTKNEEKRKTRMVEQLSNQMEAFNNHIEGEEYLLLNFPYGRGGEALYYRCVIPTDTKQNAIRFEELFREELW